jgi:uncharacterized protein YjiS (DUF1127 family)
MVTRSLPTLFTMPRTAAKPAARSVLARVAVHLAAMIQARHTRQMLLEMEPRMLADIGIGRGDALHEANKPFWDLPTE